MRESRLHPEERQVMDALAAHGRPGVLLLTAVGGARAVELVLDWRRMQRAQGRDPFVVVPSARDAVDLTRRVVEEEGVILGGPVAGTVDAVVAACLGTRALRIPPLARELAVYGAGVALWGRPGSVLGRLQRPLSALADLMEELDESGLDDRGINDGLAAWAAEARDPTARTVAVELQLLAAGYGRLCRARGIESRSRRAHAAAGLLCSHGTPVGHIEGAALAGGGAGGLPWDRPLACCGFLTFTPAQQRFIQAIARSVPVVVESGWDGSATTRFMDAEVGRWIKGGASQVECSMQPSMVDASVPAAAVEWRVLRSSGRRGELETAVAEVVQLMREGLSPGRMALVTRRVGPWRRMALEVCAQYGVPLTLDAPVRLAETRVGHVLLRGLREALAGRQPATSAQVDLRACVTEAAGEPCLVPEAVGEAARRLLHFCVAGTPESIRLEAWDVRAADAVCAAMEALGSSTFPEDGRAPREDARGLGAAELLDYLAGTRLRAAGDPGDALSLTGAARMRMLRPQVAFVLGLVDQEFPESERTPGLLSARLRRDCNRCAGVRLFDEPTDGQDAFLFRTAAAAASEVLYLSQRLADDDGAPLAASPFLLELLEASPDVRPRRTRTLADVVWEPQFAPSPREFARWCAASGIMPHGVAAASWARVRAETATHEIRVRHPENLAELAARSSFSAGEIETYARCPVLWFLDAVVGIEMPVEPGDPRELGSLVHSVLAALYPTLGRSGLLPLGPDTVEPAEAVAEDILLQKASARCSEDGQTPLLLAHARYRVRDHLRREANQGGRVTVTLTEYSLPSAGVDLADGLVVRGRVDRLDVDPDRNLCVVIDYKTGAFTPQKDWAGTGTLQVPLYVMALQQLHPEREVVAGGYLALGSGRASGFVTEAGRSLVGEGAPWRLVDHEERESLLRACRQAAAAAVEGMRGGCYPFAPGIDCPRYCRMGPVCRVPHGGGRG